MEMKIACANALAQLAREDVPDEVAAAYAGERMSYGPGYIIPAPFDPRLITRVPSAVAQAAMDSGVARRPIMDMEAYLAKLSGRLNPTANFLQNIYTSVKSKPKRVVFAEGEEEKVIRAALAFRGAGYGTPLLVGREDVIRAAMHAMGMDDDGDVEVHNARESRKTAAYADFLYKRLQRNGSLYRDCLRMVNNDRNVFAACMVALGHADAMVSGLTRNYFTTYEEVLRVIDPLPNHTVYGLSMIVTRDRTVFMADTQVNELPTAEQLAQIAKGAAATARRFGHEPRVALLSYANFGHPEGFRSDHIREARRILAEQKPDFEFDGEMSADVALNPELQKLYPFMGLSGPANVLVMPALHSANLSSKLLQELGAGTVIGPLLSGLERSVQIVPMNAGTSDIVNMAAMAAFASDLL